MASDLNIMEKAMYSLNMTSPVSRFVGIFVATNALVYFVRPSYFFDKLTKEPYPQAVIPWWALGIATGAAAAFFL